MTVIPEQIVGDAVPLNRINHSCVIMMESTIIITPALCGPIAENTLKNELKQPMNNVINPMDAACAKSMPIVLWTRMGNAAINHNQITLKIMLALTIASMDAPKIDDTSKYNAIETTVNRRAWA